jgi:predicted ATPase
VGGLVLTTGPFDEDGMADLVRWAFPAYDRAAVARLVRRVAADTAGNPFLAVELVRALRAGLRLAERPARAWPAAHHTLDDTRPGELPESVAAALRLRFRELSQPAQQALAAVAVLGGRLPVEALARGAELPRGALETALDELEWARWLVADARGYAFVTRLAREVILQDMVTGGQQRRIRQRAKTQG